MYFKYVFQLLVFQLLHNTALKMERVCNPINSLLITQLPPRIQSL